MFYVLLGKPLNKNVIWTVLLVESDARKKKNYRTQQKSTTHSKS